MTLKRIDESEMELAVTDQKEKAASADLVLYPLDRFVAVAQRQLEADQKDYDELKEELEYLYESYEIAIEVLDAEHRAVIREIFEELKKYKDFITCSDYKDAKDWHVDDDGISLSETEWKALKQKYGDK